MEAGLTEERTPSSSCIYRISNLPEPHLIKERVLSLLRLGSIRQEIVTHVNLKITQKNSK
jgi:hypothetical protein